MSLHFYPEKYDVIVVGAGHAGCEAALIAAKMGVKVLLITQNLDTIAQMSCNPSIGGVGKGQLVKEIDALGGYMAINTDLSSLNYHMLNTSRGPAVRSPRAQCDKKLYHINMKKKIESTKNIHLFQDEVKSLYFKESKLNGVITLRNTVYQADIVIITTGTFLKGIIHIGEFTSKGGRYNDPSSEFLSDEIEKLGIKKIRMKTGTPMRLNSSGIDFSLCEIQLSDNPATPFSIFTDDKWLNSKKFLPCWITRTTEETFDIINSNLQKSALYSGKIKSIGPRYCPSIEDKVYKFPHHKTHHIFLEPEGFETFEYYVNGLSTSLSEDIQHSIIKSIPSIRNAHIVRPGYAIEYDLFDPLNIKQTLESKTVENLFFAGQVNGTTGYEEAAAQGIIAGINAALKIKSKEPFILKREESYIGVMIDDLTVKGVDEPYRIFTSRAEFRILLRQDNADIRLCDYAFQLGTLNTHIYEKFKIYRTIYEELLQNPEKQINLDINNEIYPWNIENAKMAAKNQIFYSSYIERYKKELEKIHKLEEIKIPNNFDYSSINELSIETRQKLSKLKPQNLAQAYRIPGITYTDVQLIWILVEKKRYGRNKKRT
ncbi:MAG: tRNA uridine-5-carboxymethylaminomethyl(34) synthesis enzyme MnmG [Elusimicrobiales bacterium]|nr:tRNA uridine-5-carboxymethylaminomethyl(34) synthesis enzyme MnmG [Elusimicrobiales bacterium]